LSVKNLQYDGKNKSEFYRIRDSIHNFIDIILDNYWDFLFWITTIVFGLIMGDILILTYECEDYKHASLLVIFLSSAFLKFKQYNKNKSLREIQEENNELNNEINDLSYYNYNLMFENWNVLKTLCNEKLKKLVNDLNYESEVRASLYLYDDTVKAFHTPGRYAQDPELNKQGRFLYPSDVGIIGVAWKNKDNEYEENFSNHNYGTKQYLKILEMKYNLNVEDIKEFRMESVHFITIKIKNNGYNIGIILFESEKSGIMQLDKVETELEKEKNNLSLILSILKNNSSFVNTNHRVIYEKS